LNTANTALGDDDRQQGESGLKIRDIWDCFVSLDNKTDGDHKKGKTSFRRGRQGSREYPEVLL
jgi:hypothetical protein